MPSSSFERLRSSLHALMRSSSEEAGGTTAGSSNTGVRVGAAEFSDSTIGSARVGNSAWFAVLVGSGGISPADEDAGTGIAGAAMTTSSRSGDGAVAVSEFGEIARSVQTICVKSVSPCTTTTIPTMVFLREPLRLVCEAPPPTNRLGLGESHSCRISKRHRCTVNSIRNHKRSDSSWQVVPISHVRCCRYSFARQTRVRH